MGEKNDAVKFYQGTMVVADLLLQDGPYKGWVAIKWLYPGERKFSAIKDVKRIETEIRHQRLKGWLASSEREHTTMHRILSKMGATPYGEDENAIFFMKEVA